MYKLLGFYSLLNNILTNDDDDDDVYVILYKKFNYCDFLVCECT